MRMGLLGFVVVLGSMTAVGQAPTAPPPGTTFPGATVAPVPPAAATVAPKPAPKPPDWAAMGRYQAADAALPAHEKGRVVFMGDSITDAWANPKNAAVFFPGKPYVGRGISGQTTPQMLVRFRQDVIDLHPEAVVILAGTNDVAGNTGPMTAEQTEGFLQSMAELAKVSGIKVAMCSIMPVLDYPWRRGLNPSPKIQEINAWMKTYAKKNGFAYVDFYSAMDDGTGAAKAGLTGDGVHPTAAGYELMEPIVEKALAGM
jgi:lysophospholipase L1-like esterase